MTVEVFKTNVDDPQIADTLVRELEKFLPTARINFDLEDCDKILRIEGSINNFEKIPDRLQALGYECESLPD